MNRSKSSKRAQPTRKTSHVARQTSTTSRSSSASSITSLRTISTNVASAHATHGPVKKVNIATGSTKAATVSMSSSASPIVASKRTFITTSGAKSKPLAVASPVTQSKRRMAFRTTTDFGLTEDQQMFQQTARDFAENEIVPFAQDWDEKKFFPQDTLRKAAELGFASLYVREDVGGVGLSRKDAAIIFEELAVGCPAFTSYLTIHNMNSYMIDTFGTQKQREYYNPKLATLEMFSSYCLTEPNAGSDAGSLQTRAVRQGDEYVLNGTKAFISGGGVSDLYIVMARTGGEGPKGVSTFLVPKDAPGISFGANEKKMGWNCSPTAIVNFDDCRIPAENLLGDTEGNGFKYAMKGLNGGRVNIAALSLGGAQAALMRTSEYVKERKQFGKSLDANQWVQFSLADMATKLTASRLMVHRAAEMIDSDHPDATMHCAMAKKFATETCSGIADLALQLHGGYGYLKDFPLEKIVRDLRVHQILEGTNQIMDVIISRQIAKAE